MDLTVCSINQTGHFMLQKVLGEFC